MVITKRKCRACLSVARHQCFNSMFPQYDGGTASPQRIGHGNVGYGSAVLCACSLLPTNTRQRWS
eukprot:3357-Heterococcus_DN1.PRE.2